MVDRGGKIERATDGEEQESSPGSKERSSGQRERQCEVFEKQLLSGEQFFQNRFHQLQLRLSKSEKQAHPIGDELFRREGIAHRAHVIEKLLLERKYAGAREFMWYPGFGAPGRTGFDCARAQRSTVSHSVLHGVGKWLIKCETRTNGCRRTYAKLLPFPVDVPTRKNCTLLKMNSLLCNGGPRG